MSDSINEYIERRDGAKKLIQYLYEHHVRTTNQKEELSDSYKVGLLETILELKMADIPEMYKSMQNTVEFVLQTEKELLKKIDNQINELQVST